LAAQDIPTAVHYPVPLNVQPVFAGHGGSSATPISSQVAGRVLSLPMHPYLQESDLLRVVDAVASATGLER
jgi:UDP-2-acetamido-2-deoxy-ribo-hexuluronate aminotransferase